MLGKFPDEETKEEFFRSKQVCKYCTPIIENQSSNLKEKYGGCEKYKKWMSKNIPCLLANKSGDNENDSLSNYLPAPSLISENFCLLLSSKTVEIKCILVRFTTFINILKVLRNLPNIRTTTFYNNTNAHGMDLYISQAMKDLLEDEKAAAAAEEYQNEFEETEYDDEYDNE
uniref:Uncharacterized protein n=1 Tax=Panagrolaimus davidi TaxID=227884 RepID=A0A914PML5_9BILA